MAAIEEDPKTVAVPLIDAVGWEYFDYLPGDLMRGIMSWSLYFTWQTLTPDQLVRCVRRRWLHFSCKRNSAVLVRTHVLAFADASASSRNYNNNNNNKCIHLTFNNSSRQKSVTHNKQASSR